MNLLKVQHQIVKMAFIHLSTRSQIWATVYKHFNNERNLYISAFNFNSSDPNLNGICREMMNTFLIIMVSYY